MRPLKQRGFRADSWLVRVRWQFAAGLGILLVAVAGWSAYPHVRAAWNHHQEAAKDAAFVRAHASTMRALAAVQMPVPAFTQCTSWPASGAAAVCWHGTPAVGVGLADLRNAVQAIGGAFISTPCRTLPRIGLVCGIRATLAGRVIEGHIGPRISGKAGSYRYFGSDMSLSIFPDPLAGSV
jgi:hypothetical protein